MYIFICVVLVLFAFFAHEFFGHATAIRKAGVPVSKIALGLPHGPKITFPLCGKWTGTNFVIHYLCPIGAFWESDEQQISELPYWQQSRIHASGPLVTLIYACSLIVLSGLLAFAGGTHIDFSFLYRLIATIVVLGVFLRFGGKIFFTYVMPIIPVALLVLILCSFFSPSENIAVASPLVFVESMWKITDLSGALFVAGNFTGAVVGLPMLLPLQLFGVSLDGKQILQPLVQKYLPPALNFFDRFGTILFGLLIIYTLEEYGQSTILPCLVKLFS
jgi:hypothetical protein